MDWIMLTFDRLRHPYVEDTIMYISQVWNYCYSFYKVDLEIDTIFKMKFMIKSNNPFKQKPTYQNDTLHFKAYNWHGTCI